MSSASGKQTSTELASEADDVRAGLAHTLDQLRENLKPEHVIEEVVGNARVGANTLVDGLYGMAREHPIPALLIGAGCAMILGLGTQIGGRRRSPMIDVRPKAAKSSPVENRAGLAGVAEGPGARQPGFAAAPGRSETRPFGDRSFESSPPIAQDTMSKAKTYPTQSISTPKSRLAGVLHEQPLIIAALGIAVGAALGAALPGTDVEDEWMGGTSSSVKHAAQEAARHELDGLKSVASRTADNLKGTAADHGFSSDNLNDFVRDAGEHAKAAIHDMGSAAAPGRTA